MIGQGEFGTVNKGVLRTVDGPLDVAVKTLSVTTEESRVGFLQEAAIIGQFNHKNILKLYGVVLKTKPVSKGGSTFELCLLPIALSPVANGS